MKNLLALLCGLIFFTSCTDKDAPKNLIKEKDIVNLLIDMHLADAALDYSYNSDSLLIFAKSKYNYIFNKYSTDSTAFTESLNYYSKDSEKFAKIYKEVLDSLEKMNKPEVATIYRTKRFIPDSLRFPVKFRSTKDSLSGNKKIDSLTRTAKNPALLRKEKLVKDTVVKSVEISSLDAYLRKTDSLNTVKLLGIGIDF